MGSNALDLSDGVFIERVAEICDRFAVRTPDEPWPDLVLDALTFQHLNIRSRVREQARVQLDRMCAALTEQARADHRRIGGVAAERGRRVAIAHLQCPGDPSTTTRSAVRLFGALHAGGSGNEADNSIERAVALWVTARWACEIDDERRARALLQDAGGEQEVARATRELGQANTWPSSLTDLREADARRLLGDDQRLRSIRERLVAATMMPHPELTTLFEFVTTHPAEHSPACWCGSEPHMVIRTLWGNEIECAWRETDFDEDELRFIDQCATRSQNSLLRDGTMIMPLDPQGLENAVLLGCLSHLPERTVKIWHEAAVASAVRKAVVPYGTVQANVAWTLDPANPRKHGGEFDVLAMTDSFLFDFQAKAPSSADGNSRDKRIYVEAFGQHEAAAAALAQGMWLLDGSGRPRSKVPLSLGKALSVHIPISVGVEDLRDYSVGANAHDTGQMARVVTTLDHLRIVNEVVPVLFRVVYWVDRLAQEYGPLRFVNEIDYLSLWLRRLHGHPVELTVSGRLVLAQPNSVEAFLVANYIEARSRNPPFAVTRQLRQARAELQRGSSLDTAPTVRTALSALARAREPGWISLARAISGSNIQKFESLLRDKGTVGFTAGRWGLEPETGLRRADGTTSDRERLTVRQTGDNQWHLRVSNLPPPTWASRRPEVV